MRSLSRRLGALVMLTGIFLVGGHQGLDLDWNREVFVTSGATEALAACILGLVEPGDEVVLIQPMYDAYLPLVQRAGGVARFVTLQPPEWRLDEAALQKAFTPNTRLVIVNNPLNPTGTVFDRDSFPGVVQLRRYGIAVLAIIAITGLEFLQRIFTTTELDLTEWTICIGIALSLVVVEELVKLILRHRPTAPLTDPVPVPA